MRKLLFFLCFFTKLHSSELDRAIAQVLENNHIGLQESFDKSQNPYKLAINIIKSFNALKALEADKKRAHLEEIVTEEVVDEEIIAIVKEQIKKFKTDRAELEKSRPLYFGKTLHCKEFGLVLDALVDQDGKLLDIYGKIWQDPHRGR